MKKRTKSQNNKITKSEASNFDPITAFIRRYPKVLYGLFAILLLADIFYFVGTSDVRLFLIVLLWIGISSVLKLSEKESIFVIGGIFLLFVALYLSSGASAQTERAATFFYLFLLLSIIRQLWGLRHT